MLPQKLWALVLVTAAEPPTAGPRRSTKVSHLCGWQGWSLNLAAPLAASHSKVTDVSNEYPGSQVKSLTMA